MISIRDWGLFILSLAVAILLPWLLLKDESELQNNEVNLTITDIKIAASISPDNLLTKPIFNKDRGVVPETSENIELPQDDIEQPPLPPEPKLVGVAKGAGRAIAIVKGSDGMDQNIKTGENIDGWTLINISSNSATFRSQGVSKIIELDYGNKLENNLNLSNQ